MLEYIVDICNQPSNFGGIELKKYILIVLSCIILIIGGILGYTYLKKETIELSYPAFIEAVDQTQVDKVILQEGKNTFQAVLKGNPNITHIVPNPYREDFTEFLLLNGIRVRYGQDSAIANVGKLFLVGMIVGGMVWYIRKGNASSNLIKDDNKNKNKDKLITLSQIAGNAEAKSMVLDVVEFIKNPEKYAAVLDKFHYIKNHGF